MKSPKEKLSKNFYMQDLHVIAKELLGKTFVRNLGAEYLTGKIVEVEAYDGSIDEASHSFNGKTNRNQVIFSEGGLLYVYFTYGMHFCSNVVTGKADEGKAILLRAIEPTSGMKRMCVNRFGKENFSDKEFINLTNGPAKLAQAFELGRNENGIDLCGDEIYLIDEPKISDDQIVTTTRIGIKKSVDLPWRYYIKNNPFVSKK